MARRIHSRQGNGRFRRATLENTFGLSAEVCPKCRAVNAHKVNEPKPTHCHACGAPLASDHDRENRGHQ
jgi:ssDNA-binding Zn-finger/Zn-ribbon topoisomerase 1